MKIEDEKIAGFEQMEVWQDAINLAVSIYKITSSFPKSEIYSTTNQMRRASSSISANIAEGYGRYNHKEKLQFYKIANGSLLETKSFCYLSNRLDYISKDEMDSLLVDIVSLQKQISSLIRSIRDKYDKK